MTTVDQDAPGAQDDLENPPSDAGESPPPSDGSSSPPPAAPEDPTIKELRDRLSQSGRAAQAAELRARKAEQDAATIGAQLAATNARLESIGATLTREEQERQEAYLNSLPADQREREEYRLQNKRLESRLSALEGARTQTQRQPTEEEQKEATRQAARQMSYAASVEFGLDDNEQIAWNDPRLVDAGAWESADAYLRQVRILARKISTGREPSQPPEGASQVAGTPPKKAAASAQPDVAAIAAKAAEEAVAKALGSVGGAPNSPRPAAIVEERTPSEQAYQQTLRGYSPTTGPRATREALKKQVAAAEAAYNKAAR